MSIPESASPQDILSRAAQELGSANKQEWLERDGGKLHVSSTLFPNQLKATEVANSINHLFNVQIAHTAPSSRGGFCIVIPRNKIVSAPSSHTNLQKLVSAKDLSSERKESRAITNEMRKGAILNIPKELIPEGRIPYAIFPNFKKPGLYEIHTMDARHGTLERNMGDDPSHFVTVTPDQVKAWSMDAPKITEDLRPPHEQLKALVTPLEHLENARIEVQEYSGCLIRPVLKSGKIESLYLLENFYNQENLGNFCLIPTEKGIEIWPETHFDLEERKGRQGGQSLGIAQSMDEVYQTLNFLPYVPSVEGQREFNPYWGTQ